MAPRANPNINPYLMDWSVGPNLFGTCFFSQINLAATKAVKSPLSAKGIFGDFMKKVFKCFGDSGLEL